MIIVWFMPQSSYQRIPKALPKFVMKADLIISVILISHLKRLPEKVLRNIDMN